MLEIVNARSQASNLGIRDVSLGIPDIDEGATLPDLGHSKTITQDDILAQSHGLTLENSQDPVSTEEELDAVDALLSLHNVRENLVVGSEELDDNASLMPIGGQPAYEDVAPEPICLGQVAVDGEIARRMAVDELNKLNPGKTSVERSSSLTGVPSIHNPVNISDASALTTGSDPLFGIQTEQETGGSGSDPLLGVQSEQGTGA